jgi:cyclohexa-1,5-dienecarbonyl-CoA hydratase
VTLRCDLLEDGRVLRVVLDEPKGNILSMQVMSALRDALAAHRDRRELRMVLLRGAGGNFSLGASVAEHRKEQARGMLAAFSDLIRDVATYPVPVAALVEGRCLGGAFELVLACHFVFATSTAKLGCPEIKLGVLPPALAVLGPLRLGGSISERLLLTGAELDAQAADRAGLLAGVVAADRDPEEWVLSWYRKNLAPLSAFSLREAVTASRTGSGLLAAVGEPLHVAERRYVERLLPSRDANEGIEAFLEKRAPLWVDA